MLKKICLRVCLGLAALSAGDALAQGEAKSVAPPSNPDAVHTQIQDSAFRKEGMVDAKGRKITVINFEDAVIEGAARAPDGFVLQSRQAGTFRTILDLRREFRLQIQSSATSSATVVPAAP